MLTYIPVVVDEVELSNEEQEGRYLALILFANAVRLTIGFSSAETISPHVGFGSALWVKQIITCVSCSIGSEYILHIFLTS